MASRDHVIKLMLQMGMGTEARGRERRRSEPTVRNLSGAELNPEVCWSLTLQAVWQEACSAPVLSSVEDYRGVLRS